MKNLSRFADSKKAKVTSLENDKNVDFNWGVKTPMRDGVQLNATIYKPKSVQPTSVIFTLTPYIADSYHPRVQKIAIFYRTRDHAFHLFCLLKSERTI